MSDVREIANQAKALRAAGKTQAAVPLLRQVVAQSPASGVAEHNLAAALGDIGRWREAELHVRQAFAKGLDAPESWLVLGRAAMMSMRVSDAEHAFQEALRRRANFPEAHRDLAQLRWMTSGDIRMATEQLDAAIEAAPQDFGLVLVKAKALENAGLAAEAADLLLGLHLANPSHAETAAIAAHSALLAGRTELALRLSADAVRLSPSAPNCLIVRVESLLAAGEGQAALPLAERLCALQPESQNSIALLATVWRVLGDSRYRALYDYDSFVLSTQLDCPPGWSTLESYLAELAEALTAAHGYQAHPFDQSIKFGAQAPSILDIELPAIQALPRALDAPIREYLDKIGHGDDPLRSRNTGRYTFHGIWSIRMQAGGRHIDHVHPEGWISSACYVTVPTITGREGWIKFGEPGLPTDPPCPAEYFVEPKPGRLVLFPSYMWHGTIPFSGEGVRTTFALDILPD